MIRSAALAVLLAAPASAQVRVSPAASAWSGPVTAVFAAAGQERVAALGMVSLARLASPGDDGRMPVVSAPQTLNYLDQALEEAAVDVEVFAKRPTHERLAVLRVAAEIAEEKARLSADGLAEAAATGFARRADGGTTVPASAVKAVLTHYNASVDETGLDFSLRARVLAAIRTGRDGLPAWDALMAAKEETRRALHRGALRSLVAYIVGMVALFAGVADLFTGGAKFLVFAASMAPIVYMMTLIWRRDSLEWADSWGLREHIRRAFPND